LDHQIKDLENQIKGVETGIANLKEEHKKEITAKIKKFNDEISRLYNYAITFDLSNSNDADKGTVVYIVNGKGEITTELVNNNKIDNIEIKKK
jgi:hypothetical protein